MHLYTVIQLLCLGFLLGIKFTPAAIGFPFFLAMLIPLRLLGLPKIFTEAEINAVSYPRTVLDPSRDFLTTTIQFRVPADNVLVSRQILIPVM